MMLNLYSSLFYVFMCLVWFGINMYFMSFCMCILPDGFDFIYGIIRWPA